MHLEKVNASQPGCTDIALEVTRRLDSCGNPTNALSCSSARIEMCKDLAQSMESRRECNSKIVLRLISIGGLCSTTSYNSTTSTTSYNSTTSTTSCNWSMKAFYCSRIARIAPSCHLMGLRLPKPNNSFSAFLDSNFTNVPQLSDSLITELPQ